MVFFDWARRARRRRPDTGDLADLSEFTDADAARADSRTERGSGYLAVRRTVEASQRDFDGAAHEKSPSGRHRAAFLRLDRMYEVAMLVAAACEVPGVPPPEPITAWPSELVRLRDLREGNARRARATAGQSSAFDTGEA